MRWCLTLLLLLTLPACTTPKAAPPTSATTKIQDPKSLPTFHSNGTPASWQDLLTACKDADIVLLGENHGHPTGLPFAAALWRDLLPDCPKAALALEFFERDEQSRLDEFLLGIVDEPTFKKRTQRSASNYPAAHRDMVEAAKDHARPVIAANAPRPLVRLSRTEGFDRLRALPPSLQQLARIPDTIPEGRYRDDFFKLMTGQADEAPPTDPDPEALARAESMFRAQSVWDWTMADSVVRALSDGNHPVALVVGRFHIDHQGGLVQAIHHLAPNAKVVTITTVDDTSHLLRDDDKSRATFVVYVGPATAPN